MPGIFSAVGCTDHFNEQLRSEFLSPWGTGEYVELSGGMLGGHSFGNTLVLHRTGSGVSFAVDGEESIYRSARAFAEGTGPELFRITSEGLTLTPTCKGNVIAADPNSGRWFLATEVMGSFPLYYALIQDGLLVCSRLKPLARILKSELDLVGIREFLHELYILNGRTFFKDIYRLMPGQSLEYDPQASKIHLREKSAAWSRTTEPEFSDLTEATKLGWNLLVQAIRRCFSRDLQSGLMISGGWDSRTLLAAMRECLPPSQIRAYLHGNPDSREAKIAEQICSLSNLEITKRAFDTDLYKPEVLQAGFDRVETVLFPEWHRAGILLNDRGVRNVTAGIYGEVLGGHYGSAMLLSGVKKIAAVGAELGGCSKWISEDTSQTYEAARNKLYLSEISKPWYLAPDVLERLSNVKEDINEDITLTLQRLEQRGVGGATQLLEAFITEHRGGQYIASQLLSCRAYTNISLPFGDNDLLVMASQISSGTKIHNRLNRKLLQQFAPDLLTLPCASMLLAAKHPILIQEASRLARLAIERSLWRAHFATQGFVNPPKFSYWDLEFLRTGNALQTLAQNLHSSLWDREAINQRLRGLKDSHDLLSLSQQILKIYNVDLMIR